MFLSEIAVSLLVRLWVEIDCLFDERKPITVSLLVRLWVEIMPGQGGWTACAVSLLVRLWVEMLHVLRRDFQLPSASLWGCELKYHHWLQNYADSWSASLWGCELKWNWNPGGQTGRCVSLLVRLWVEIPTHCYHRFSLFVSLLVRLWVEMFSTRPLAIARASQPPCEAVSWNVMLPGVCCCPTCQPPCEAVSWNQY